jgi:hypothetical protein
MMWKREEVKGGLPRQTGSWGVLRKAWENEERKGG